MVFTIDVTSDVIACGTKKHCEFCPIALAIRRCVPLLRDAEIRVRLADVQFSRKTFVSVEQLHFSVLPEAAQTFIIKFDSLIENDKADPFTFQLDVPKQFVA